MNISKYLALIFWIYYSLAIIAGGALHLKSKYMYNHGTSVIIEEFLYSIYLICFERLDWRDGVNNFYYVVLIFSYLVN